MKKERRGYIRLNSCFPVEFSLYFTKTKPISREYQGFTRNISKAGLCVSVRNLNQGDTDLVFQKKVRLNLNINVPLSASPTSATAEIAWCEKDDEDSSGRTYLLGLSYADIDHKEKERIFNYARRLKWMPRIVGLFLVLLSLGFGGLFLHNINAVRDNQELVKELVTVLEVKSSLDEELGAINKTKSQLESKLAAAQGDRERQDAFSKEIERIRQGESSLEEQLASIKARSGELEEASVDKMLRWLAVHQNRSTGLIASYEGDKSLKDMAFTYDQALAVQAFLASGDIKRAQAILNFYSGKAEQSDGLYYNAYDAKTGLLREYTIQSGPNAWIGISACQYVEQTGDKGLLAVAEAIADILIRMQDGSTDKGIKGGPDLDWVSTEHNLDAYALFRMLYNITQDKRYEIAAAATLGWLKDVGYNRPEARPMRGRGDATIATDTFSWAIASIGPDTLMQNDMDPDDIMEFAENECKVSAVFVRPEKKYLTVVGFDFAKAQHVGRGGIISTEWTGQMIVAFTIMADYHRDRGDREKEKIYLSKAEYYLSQLGKMVISSPSPTGQGEGCLPYASVDNVDTGHGWRVARGHRTGSVAATAYYIFASRSYNPLGD